MDALLILACALILGAIERHDRLGLYAVAFYGERGTPLQRRQLRDAWRTARTIAEGIR